MKQIIASLGRYPHTASLLDSTVELDDGLLLETSPGGLATSSLMMIQDLAFDVCDMPVVNYLSAREHGMRATAIPVFVTRRFPQGMLIWNRETGVRRASDLEGHRIGTPYYGNTDAVWVRGLLKDFYGVDHERITWVTASEEKIAQASLPTNVEQRLGASLEQMLLAGDLAALVEPRGQVTFDPRLDCLESNLAEAEERWYRATGLFPTLHTVVIKDATLAEIPELGAVLLREFFDAKRVALQRLESGVELNTADLEAAKISGFPTQPYAESSRAYLGPDPLRYGFSANLSCIETLIRFATDQHVVKSSVVADAAFLPLD